MEVVSLSPIRVAFWIDDDEYEYYEEILQEIKRNFKEQGFRR